MSDYDVVVIGAGAIGGVAARSAAEAGARVLLLERKGETAEPSLCTGLVSPRTLFALGITELSCLRSIRSVVAHAPGGRRLTIRTPTAKALVLDRSRVEGQLRKRAADAGVAVRFQCDACSVRAGEVAFRSPRGRETVSAGIVVGAIGLNETFARIASFPRPPRLFNAAQASVAYESDEEDTVRVYLGRETAPRFFGWAVPAEPGGMRVGVAVPPGMDPGPFLDGLLQRRFADTPVRFRRHGRIPIGPVREPIGDGFLLVGDAAGHVKPLSGGGLYTGAICARIAGRIAAAAAIQGRTKREDLGTYVDACERAIGSELRFGLAARDLLESLSDEGIDEAFALLDRPELLRFVGEVGDIDRLRHLPREIASRRSLWSRILPLLSLIDRHLAARGPQQRLAASPDAPL